MALISQFDKIAIIAKRETEFTDEKSGKLKHFRYVTGFNAVSGAVFSDLAIDDVSPVGYDAVRENAVYDCLFVNSTVKDSKNAVRVASVKLERLIGTLEFKPSKV